MSEDLKKTIAKTLLITQLFSPINIKFINKTYKEYKELTDYSFAQVNNFVIEKTNPFDNRTIFFDQELLLYENREQAIEELMKSVDLNWKISKQAKQNIQAIRNFLKDNPHIDLKTIYNIFGELTIEKNNKLLSDNTVMKTNIKYTTNKDMPSGINTLYDAQIYINDNYQFLSDEQFCQSLFHELVHLLGDFKIYRNGKSVGDGLNEGMTSLIEYDYHGCLEKKGESYFFLRTCTKMLAEIAGPDILLQCFSENNLPKLNDELKKKGVLEDDFVSLILNLDNFLEGYKKSNHSKITNKTEQIIDFFQNYRFLITDEVSKIIYDSYLEILKKYVFESCVLDVVYKIYYNSEEKNKIPCFQYRVSSEELSQLPYSYKIVTSDENDAYILIPIDEIYENLKDEKSL